MGPSPLRLIETRGEWAQLARLASSLYHEPDWSAQVCRRIVGHGRVRSAYLRVWCGENLIGCPMIVVGQRAFNSPRALPEVLVGDGSTVEPAAELAHHARHVRLRGMPQFAFHDDRAHHQLVAADHRRLHRRTASTRRHLNLSPGEVGDLCSLARWRSPRHRQTWERSLVGLFRAAAWRTEVVEHFDGTGLIGVSVWGSRGETLELLGVLIAGRQAHVWLPPR